MYSVVRENVYDPRKLALYRRPPLGVTSGSQLLAAIFLLHVVPCCALPQAAPATQKSPVTIPIQVAANLVYMHGRINDSRQLSVALDTGSSFSIVAPAIAQQLDLHTSGTTEAAGIGHGSSQTVRFVEGARLQWGDEASRVSIENQRIAVLPIDYIADQVGIPTDAIFGSNVFENFRVTVDYKHQRASFASPDSPLVDAGESIPIRILGGTPYVTATLYGASSSGVSGLFLLDSGTTGALILNQQFLSAHPKLIAGRKFVDTPSVNAVGGTINLKLVRIAGLRLGSFKFDQVVVAVPQSSTGVFANPEIAGFIGADIMRRFAVTWDYAHQRVLLKPNSYLNEGFEADASGLRLTVEPPDYTTIHVAAMLPDSPAAAAGLRVGDVVTAFNGARDLPLWHVVDELRKPDSSPVLSILRDHKHLTVTLHLRRLV